MLWLLCGALLYSCGVLFILMSCCGGKKKTGTKKSSGSGKRKKKSHVKHKEVATTIQNQQKPETAQLQQQSVKWRTKMPPATQNTFDGGMSTRRLDSLPESLMSGRPVAKKKPAPAPPPPPKQQEKPQPKQPPKNAKMEKNNQKKKSAPAPVAIPDKLKKADKSTKADKPKEADNKKEADKPKETDKPKKAEPPRKIAKTALEKEATVFEVVDPEAIFSEPEGDSAPERLTTQKTVEETSGEKHVDTMRTIADSQKPQTPKEAKKKGGGGTTTVDTQRTMEDDQKDEESDEEDEEDG